MITIERAASLSEMCKVENLAGVMFTEEDGGHEFLITGFLNGERVPFTGDIGGRFVTGSGDTVDLTGSLSDGRARVMLPDDCYADGGMFSMVISHSDGGERTVIYACTGYISTM